jgi:hypothetical protein
MRDARLCASHSGRCGARPGNRNAIRHGLYSRSLSAEERLNLAAAYAIKGVDEEIAVTRLMIARALRQPDVPPAAYARLADTLCRQLRLQRQLTSDGGSTWQAALSTLLDTAAAALVRAPAQPAPATRRPCAVARRPGLPQPPPRRAVPGRWLLQHSASPPASASPAVLSPFPRREGGPGGLGPPAPTVQPFSAQPATPQGCGTATVRPPLAQAL